MTQVLWASQAVLVLPVQVVCWAALERSVFKDLVDALELQATLDLLAGLAAPDTPDPRAGLE